MTETASNAARGEILSGVRAALGRFPGEPVPAVPASIRIPARVPGRAEDEMAKFLDEACKLGGKTRRVGAGVLRDALAELVEVERIRKAALWQTPRLQALGAARFLRSLGVEIVPAAAGTPALARCDMGVTDVAMALPETGTLILRSSPECPRAVSLLPRVHLALVHAEDLRTDMATALRELRADPYFVFVTGPSRTADIELTVTIGVHGPQVLAVWAVA